MNAELSPYHRQLRDDLIDYEIFRTGLEAYERVIKRCERSEEFYKLPAELQARLRGVK